MLTFPLTKHDKKLFKEFEQYMTERSQEISIEVSDTDYDKYSEIIETMQEKDAIYLIEMDYGRFIQERSMNSFKVWLLNEDKKSRIPGKREWRIALSTFFLSAIVSIITTLITIKIKG